MTVVDTDTISVVDDKKSMNIDLSDSLFGKTLSSYHLAQKSLTSVCVC